VHIGTSASIGQLPFTDHAKTALDLSMKEAVELEHNYIGTEHLLLGLLKEGDGLAVKVLMDLGHDLDGVRKEVIKLLSCEVPPQDKEDSSMPHEKSERARPDFLQRIWSRFWRRFTRP